VGEGVPLIVVGWLATGIFLCGALARLAVGRLIERTPPHLLFAAVATVQFIGVVRTGYARSRASCAASSALLLISAHKSAGTCFAGRLISKVIGIRSEFLARLGC
jgi:nitrate/nitrite transporter NarK